MSPIENGGEDVDVEGSAEEKPQDDQRGLGTPEIIIHYYEKLNSQVGFKSPLPLHGCPSLELAQKRTPDEFLSHPFREKEPRQTSCNCSPGGHTTRFSSR